MWEWDRDHSVRGGNAISRTFPSYSENAPYFLLLSTMAHFLLKAPTSHLLSVYQDEHRMKHVDCNFIKEKKLRAFFEYCVSYCEISMTPLAHSPQPPVP